MQLIQLRDHSGARRLMIMWGALTGIYLIAVLYRLLVLHQPVGLPTYAGVSAVAGVWFALIDSASPRDAFKVGAIASLLTSVALNAGIITRAVLTGRAVPLARFLFTVLLLIGLLNATLRTQRHFTRKETE